MKSLNDMYGQLRQLYEKEKSKNSSFEKNLLLANKKQVSLGEDSIFSDHYGWCSVDGNFAEEDRIHKLISCFQEDCLTSLPI